MENIVNKILYSKGDKTVPDYTKEIERRRTFAIISRGLVVIGHNGRFFPQFIGVFLHIAVDFLPDFRRDLVFEEGKRLAALLSHVVVRGVAHLLDLDQLCILQQLGKPESEDLCFDYE